MSVETWGPEHFSAAAAVVGVLVAIIAGVFAYFQVKLAREVRAQQTRPYVIVDFEFRRELISIAVRNIGATPARNVVVSFDQPLQASPAQAAQTNINDATMFTAPITFMAPGRVMTVPLDTGPNLFNADGIPLAYTASVSYLGDDPKETFDEQYPLDLMPFKNTSLGSPGIPEIAERLKDIHRDLERVTATSGHVRVKSTDQDIEDRREGRAYRVDQGRTVLKERGARAWLRWWLDETAVRYGWRWR